MNIVNVNARQWIFYAVIAIAAGLLWNYFLVSSISKHLDSVFLYEVLENIIKTGQPVSETVASWVPMAQIMAAHFDVACVNDFELPDGASFNVIDNHAYYFLYLMSPFVKVFGSESSLALFNAITYLSLLIIPALFLKKQGVNGWGIAFFVVALIMYPGWSQGALGDYYVDRFYMPLMLFLLFGLYKFTQSGAIKPKQLLIIASIAVLAALCTERAAVMVLAVLAFFVVLFPHHWKHKNFLVFSGVLLLSLFFYLYWYFHFEFKPVLGKSLLSTVHLDLQWLLARLHSPKMLPFLLTNILFLGWLSLLSGWRMVLLLIGAMLPNLLITIGGAELNGWYTHYHSMYIPFLIFTAALGLVYLYKNILVRVRFKSAIFSVLLIAELIVGAKFNPENAHWEKGGGLRNAYGLTSSFFRFYVKPNDSDVRVNAIYLNQLNEKIPSGAKVTLLDGAMPALYNGRHLSLYPFDFKTADYAVIGGQLKDGVVSNPDGAINYEDNKAYNQCLLDRLISQGYVAVDSIPAVGVVILKRQQ